MNAETPPASAGSTTAEGAGSNAAGGPRPAAPPRKSLDLPAHPPAPAIDPDDLIRDQIRGVLERIREAQAIIAERGPVVPYGKGWRANPFVRLEADQRALLIRLLAALRSPAGSTLDEELERLLGDPGA